jgi:hypothetical protein
VTSKTLRKKVVSTLSSTHLNPGVASKCEACIKRASGDRTIDSRARDLLLPAFCPWSTVPVNCSKVHGAPGFQYRALLEIFSNRQFDASRRPLRTASEVELFEHILHHIMSAARAKACTGKLLEETFQRRLLLQRDQGSETFVVDGA